jgi:hypothetical protein
MLAGVAKPLPSWTRFRDAGRLPRVELGLVGAMRRDVAGAGCQLDVTIVNIVNCALQIAPTWVQYRRET